MFHPVECFIGLRYVRSRRRRGLASFMSVVSALGIGLGVAALIVILSVMNGFEAELRSRLLRMTEHASVTAADGGPLEAWQPLAERLAAVPGVTGVSPLVTLEGMIANRANLRPAALRGVLPQDPVTADELRDLVVDGSLDALEPGRILLGRILALNLGVAVGDRVTLLVPAFDGAGSATDGPWRVRLEREGVLVAGIFEAGIQDHDSSLALLHIEQASALEGLGGAPESLGIRLDDPLAVGTLAERAGIREEPSLAYEDWTETHRTYFRAIRIEKTMMTVILLFIVGVAAFNIVASLMMVVTDKRKDIAILRTYGLEPGRVARIFVVQGAAIGVAGTLLGVVLGLVLAFNVGTIVPWLETTFDFQIMPGDVYYVTDIPSEVHLADVILVPALALAIALAATIYPSRRAAAVAPAIALRYE